MSAASTISFDALDVPALKSKRWIFWSIFFLVMVPGTFVVYVALVSLKPGFIPKGTTTLNVVFGIAVAFLIAAAITFIGRAVKLSKWARQALAQFARDNGFIRLDNYVLKDYASQSARDETLGLNLRDVYEGTYLGTPFSLCHFTQLDGSARHARTVNTVMLRFKKADVITNNAESEVSVGDSPVDGQYAYFGATTDDYFWVKPLPGLFNKAAAVVRQ